jgi:beta-glucanase (GH16 family)
MTRYLEWITLISKFWLDNKKVTNCQCSGPEAWVNWIMINYPLFKRMIVFPLFIYPASISVIAQESIPVKDYRLVWQDNFNGTELDKTKWGFRGLGKRGDSFKSKDAVRLDGKGHLVIEVNVRNDSVFSGMIATENKFEPLYGFFECRASLATCPGIFPAFWLQSRSNRDYGTPERNGVELDIFEYFPHAKKDSVAHTLHWGGYGPSHQVAGPVWGALQKSKDGFHTFGLEWTPDGYTTFVDGIKTYTGNVLVSKVAEFMILSIAVNKSAAGPLDHSCLPDRFIVDYVRVYKKNKDPG